MDNEEAEDPFFLEVKTLFLIFFDFFSIFIKKRLAFFKFGVIL